MLRLKLSTNCQCLKLIHLGSQTVKIIYFERDSYCRKQKYEYFHPNYRKLPEQLRASGAVNTTYQQGIFRDLFEELCKSFPYFVSLASKGQTTRSKCCLCKHTNTCCRYVQLLVTSVDMPGFQTIFHFVSKYCLPLCSKQKNIWVIENTLKLLTTLN